MSEAQKKQVPFLNRELSWMDFNARVLEEATKRENPLMERLRFLSITASNLDEFFMVRVAGVKDQVAEGYKKTDDSGLSSKALLEALEVKTHAFVDKQYSCLLRSIIPMMKRHQIYYLSPAQMNAEQTKYVESYFHTVLFPVLTPLAVDGSRPFPLLSNKSLNIAVRLKAKEGEKGAENCFAVVQVPSILPRFITLPAPEGEHCYILLEEVIIHFLPHLFELHIIKSASPFRITRNSDLEIDEEAEDFLDEVQRSIKRRKRGRPVRLELASSAEKQVRKFLIEALKLKSGEVYEIPGPIDLTFLFKFVSLPAFESLCYQPITPMPAADFLEKEDIFSLIREKDRLVHLPYESFDCITDFVRTAAVDADVLAIKQTLYRVSGHSPIIAALIQAAENGKQVTVLVELKARFDEENNIIWAKKLEKAGCHVIYGLQGLKTHCKISLVVRREEDGIRRYLHMGTGNYNDSTAKIYTDLGLFTCDNKLGADASSLFNVITGYSRPPVYHHFVVAPHDMRNFFIAQIRSEIEHAKQGLPTGIIAKINALVDAEIIRELYTASQAGVPIKLIVRGICCLIPGLEGISENIQVRSIVGQLLEHSRIFRFEHTGSPRIYLGSADWMPRNLDKRIELVFPVLDETLKARIDEILNIQLNDNTNARIMLPDGSYQHVNRRGTPPLNSQQAFHLMAKEATRAKRTIGKEDTLIPIHSADLPGN